jgi:hypothetical protein
VQQCCSAAQGHSIVQRSRSRTLPGALFCWPMMHSCQAEHPIRLHLTSRLTFFPRPRNFVFHMTWQRAKRGAEVMSSLLSQTARRPLSDKQAAAAAARALASCRLWPFAASPGRQ